MEVSDLSDFIRPLDDAGGADVAPPTPTPPPKPEYPSYQNSTKDNAQQDGVNSLKRMEFLFRGKSYKLAVNPEQYTQTEPNRVTVTQTKAGAWVDDFGGGVVEINLKGTTGFNNSTGDNVNGFKKFKELRNLIRDYYFKTEPGTVIGEKDELTFYNFTDGEAWIVVPKTFSLLRSVSRPLLYAYDISLICIRPAQLPNRSSRSSSSYEVTVKDESLIQDNTYKRSRDALWEGSITPPSSADPVEIKTTVVGDDNKSIVYSYQPPSTRNAFTSDITDTEDNPLTPPPLTDTPKPGFSYTPPPKAIYSVPDNTSDDWIVPDIPTGLKTSINNLSEVIGDYGGRINSATMSVALRNVSLVSPGVLSSGETLNTYGRENEEKLGYVYTEHSSRVSFSCYKVTSRLSSGGKDLLYVGDISSNTVLSPLLKDLNMVPVEVSIACQVVYLESYSLYIDLLTFCKTGYPISHTRSDVDNALHNLEWTINQLSCVSKISQVISVIDCLHQVLRSLSMCKEYDIVFNGCITKEQSPTINPNLNGYKLPVLTSERG